MVIYGWNAKVLKETPFSGHQCTNCGHENTHIIVTGSYAHIFWIPLFPYRKTLRVICDNCQHSNKPKEVSEDVRSLGKQLKSKVSFPLYMFSGIGLVLALMGYFTVSTFLHAKQFERLLSEPEVNDVYYIYDKNEPTELKYSLLKVIDIREDSIDVSPNSFGYSYEPIVLMEADGFYDAYFTYHRNQIRDMYDRDELKRVTRKSLENTGMDRVIEYNLEEY